MLKKTKQPKKQNNEEKELVDFNVDVIKFLDNKDYLSELTEDEKVEMIRQGSSVYNNKAFLTVINHLINIQASHSILQAANSQLIMFDRAGINCLTLLKDEFKKLDAIYKDKIKSEEDYDEHEII